MFYLLTFGALFPKFRAEDWNVEKAPSPPDGALIALGWFRVRE
jgi:hypothetical protein